MKPIVMQEEPVFETPRRRAAISLAYDGGDRSHLEVAVQALSARGMKATFFLPSTAALADPRGWIAAANEGHEMGSHSLDGFTDERGCLPNWTLDMVEEDLRMSRKLLTELFPSQTDYAFAYPGDLTDCVSTPYNPQPTTYEPIVNKLFRVARTAICGANDTAKLNPSRLMSIDTFGMTYSDMVALLERAIEDKSYLILNFRGIGSGDFGIDGRQHELFLDCLDANRSQLEIAPVCSYALRATAPSGMFFE